MLIKNISTSYKITVTNRLCRACRQKFYFDGRLRAASRASIDRQADNNCCGSCQFWSDVLMDDAGTTDSIIISREHYRLSSKNSMFNMGGQLHDIRYSNGKKAHVYLSHQGRIPEHITAPLLDDNAVFIRG